MAKNGKKLVYDVSFVTNLDNISKQLKTDLSNIKVDFPMNNLKASGYFKTLENTIKNFETQYKGLVKNISQPGISSKQILSFLDGFKTTVDVTKSSLQSFRNGLSNTFNAQDLKPLKDLENQLKRVQKASEDVGNLRGQRAGLLKEASSVSGKQMNYSKMTNTLDRYTRLEGVEASGGSMRINDQSWMKEVGKSISHLAEIKKQVDEVDKKINLELEKASQSTGREIIKGTKEEFSNVSAGILNDIKAMNTQVISQKQYDTINKNAEGLTKTYKDLGRTFTEVRDKAEESTEAQEQAMQDTEKVAQSLKSILGELGIVLSGAWVINQLKNLARESFNFYKSLDNALTEISIVSDLSRIQVQGLTDDFIRLSKQTGMAIDDIAQASVIFFQQGLSTDEVLTMTEVTAQFAKVAGVGVADAADKLTAAVNGFQIGVNKAADVADKLNAVAAKSAASIDELSTAFEKAASMASQAGISMDSYLAYIATMVEVTREAPENIGTSLKTIIARFQQVKEAGISEDLETDANQVETALRSVGIALRDEHGQLRELEEVLNELGPMWGTLDRNTQAYLGTVIAGTRQQSRLVALMQNWDRALELTVISEQSAGAQALMHEKAMQGLDAAINMTINSWQKFLAQLTSSDFLIQTINLVTSLLDSLSNKNVQRSLVFVGLLIGIQQLQKILPTVMNAGAALFDKFTKGGKAAAERVKELNEEIERTSKIKNVGGVRGVRTSKEERAALSASLGRSVGKAEKLNNEEILLLYKQRLEVQRQMKTVSEAEITSLETKIGRTQELVNYEKQIALAKEEAGRRGAETVSATATSAVSLIGLLTGLLALFGGLDSALGQLALGAASLAVGIYAGVKALKQLQAASVITMATMGPILQIIGLVVGGVIALASASKKSAARILEDLQEQAEKTNELAQAMENQRTTLRATQQSIQAYERLSAKINKTKEEQKQLNEAATALATQYENVALSYDKYGNAVINMATLQEEVGKKNEERLKTQEALVKSIAQISATMALKSGGRTAEEQEEYNKQNKGVLGGIKIGQLNRNSKRLSSSYTANIGPSLAEQGKNWVKGVESQKEALIQAYGDLTESSTKALKDAEGTILASESTRSFLQENLQSGVIDNFIEQMENQGWDEEFLATELQEYMVNWQKSWSENASVYDDWSQSIEEVSDDIQKMGNRLSFGEAQKSIEKITKQAAGAIGIVDKGQIQAMVDSAMDVAFNGIGFSITALLDKFKDDPRMTEMIQGLSTEMVKVFENLDLFSGEDGNIELLQAISGQMETIRAAYANSGEEGAATLFKALSDAMLAPGATDEVKAAAQKAMDGVMGSLQVSSDKTWGQIADFLTESSDSLRTMNSLVESLADNGGWTLDEFSKLAKVMDSINIDNLSPEQVEKFTGAVESLNLGMDASKGLITAQGDAVKTLRELQEQAFLAEIEEMKKGLEAKLAGMEVEKSLVDAEIATNEALIKYLGANTESEITMEDVKSEADTLYAQNNAKAGLKVQENLKSMNNDSYIWARTNLANIEKVGRAYNALATGNYGYFDASKGSIVGQIQKLYNDMKWGGFDTTLSDYKNIKGTLSSEDIGDMIGKLEAYNTNLKTSSKSYEDAMKNIRAKILALTNISKTDLSKLGGSGSAQTKKIEDYVRQLTEILNILRQIERLDHRLTILRDYQDLAVEKQYTDILLKQLAIVNEQKINYKKLFDLQKKEVNSLASNLLSGKYSKLVSFLEDGSIQYDDAKYQKLTDAQAKEFDELYEGYKNAFDDMVDYHETAMQYWKDEIDIMQERVDTYIDAENQILGAVKKREQDILDVKLEAIDKEIEAINKAAELRKKAREDENSSKEIAKLQTDLQRALMDTSAGSATKVLEIQEQIREKQKEMADGSFDRMVEDEIQAREDQKETEQEAFDDRLEKMDYYWEEVDRIMSEGTESILDTLRQYSDEYLRASDAEQEEIVNGWTDIFERITDLGKGKVSELQDAILALKKNLDVSDWDNILSEGTMNTTPPPAATPAPKKTTAPKLAVGSYISVKPKTKWYADSYGGGSSGKAKAGTIKYVNTKGSHAYNIGGAGWVRKSDIVGYDTGGLNTTTGLAMLHGTTTKPEAVLNALQTKTFIKFTSALDNLTSGGNAIGSGLGSNVNIETIQFQVDSMSSEEDGRKAFATFVNRFNEIGKQKGLSVRLPN